MEGWESEGSGKLTCRSSVSALLVLHPDSVGHHRV